MVNDKDKQEIDDIEKTMVMSLSTLSTKVEDVKQKGVKKEKKTSKKTQEEANDTREASVKKPPLVPQATMPIMEKINKQEEERVSEDIKKETVDIKQDIKGEAETKDNKCEVKGNEQVDKSINDKEESSSDDIQSISNVNEPEDNKAEPIQEKEHQDEHEEIEQKKMEKPLPQQAIASSNGDEEKSIEERKEQKDKLDQEEENQKECEKIEQKEAEKPLPQQTVASTNSEATSIEEQKEKKDKLTLEEKRRIERSNLMTIEEKRALQKEGKLPSASDDKKKFSDDMNKVDYALLIVSMLMGWFVTYRIFSYFSWGYALLCFLIIHIILVGTFFLSRKKRKIGLGINIGVSIILLILSILMFKVNDFTDQIFDNSESEMIMLVAKKDSPISEKDDFKDKKIAFIKSDGDTNTFAKEMLTEAKKESYEENVFVTYKEAYEALMSDDVDMMIYTSFTKQRLAEDEIQSWDEIKVVMQKSRALKAVESKKVDISKDPFNIYISGVDLTSYSINEKGSSDVNIIMTVNPQTEKIIMQTIPRDTWAGLTCSNGEHTKLTYAGAYGGIDCSIKTIEELIGIDINYYAKINFQGVIDLVDALGGITVNSNVSFCEAHSMEGYGVQNYCYNAGNNTLDGVNALMFARIRKVFSDGDVERGRHQMEVINAVIRKFNESPSLGNINALLGAVEDNFTTNLEEDDIGKGLELLLGMGDSFSNIETVTMEGELVWKTDEVSNEYLYYFIPNDGQIDLVKQRIQDVMDGK